MVRRGRLCGHAPLDTTANIFELQPGVDPSNRIDGLRRQLCCNKVNLVYLTQLVGVDTAVAFVAHVLVNDEWPAEAEQHAAIAERVRLLADRGSFDFVFHAQAFPREPKTGPEWYGAAHYSSE